MPFIVLLFICFSPFSKAQVVPVKKDSTETIYLIEGDSVPRSSIELREVIVLPRLSFENNQERRRYLILRRRTHKVYPYAKLAAERFVTLKKRLTAIEKKSDKRRYAKRVQKYIESEFSAELKKLTKSEGRILLKLIYRQTGETAFDLIKELRNGWKAFWYNNTAAVFDLSLKVTYDPLNVEEDYLIEDILLRAFQNQILERQNPAFEINFYDASDKWAVTHLKSTD
ncbi:MAG TPA: DUF4294 domain-containing protein [Cytophagales bacterium]|nr:DUF4294 domain-containing protein [Cytophagales bacterium]